MDIPAEIEWQFLEAAAKYFQAWKSLQYAIEQGDKGNISSCQRTKNRAGVQYRKLRDGLFVQKGGGPNPMLVNPTIREKIVSKELCGQLLSDEDGFKALCIQPYGVEHTHHDLSAKGAVAHGSAAELSVDELCPHGWVRDMACDECGRSGFRFEGWNDGESVEDDLVDAESLDGPDFRCERMKDKIMTEENWRKIHDEHKGFLRQEYRKEYNETQPPSYKLYHLICPGCRASLQCMEELGRSNLDYDNRTSS